MALTPARWLSLLLLLLGVVFVALAPPKHEGSAILGFVQEVTGFHRSDRFYGIGMDGRDPERARLSRLERVLHRAERRYLALQHQQEAAGYHLRVRQDTGAVRTLFEGEVPIATRTIGERLAQGVRRNLAVTGTARAPVVIVVRSGKGREEAPALWSALAAAPGGCAVVVTLDSLGLTPEVSRHGCSAQLLHLPRRLRRAGGGDAGAAGCPDVGSHQWRGIQRAGALCGGGRSGSPLVAFAPDGLDGA